MCIKSFLLQKIQWATLKQCPSPSGLHTMLYIIGHWKCDLSLFPNTYIVVSFSIKLCFSQGHIQGLISNRGLWALRDIVLSLVVSKPYRDSCHFLNLGAGIEYWSVMKGRLCHPLLVTDLITSWLYYKQQSEKILYVYNIKINYTSVAMPNIALTNCSF